MISGFLPTYVFSNDFKFFKSEPFTVLISPVAERFGLPSSDLRSSRRPTRVTGTETFRIVSSAVAESFKLSASDLSFPQHPIVEFSRLAHHCGRINVMAFRRCGRFRTLTLRFRMDSHPMCYVARVDFVYM